MCTCLKLYPHLTCTLPALTCANLHSPVLTYTSPVLTCSCLCAGSMRRLESELESRGVVTDAREPDILRAAPVPLYNSYADVHAFAERLDAALSELAISATSPGLTQRQ